MQPAPLNSNQWHAAIVGDLSVRQVVENVVNENNAWFPAVLAATAPGIPAGAGMRHGRVFRHLGEEGRRTTLLDYSAGASNFAGRCSRRLACREFPGRRVPDTSVRGRRL